MKTFKEAANVSGRTENGAATNISSQSALVDFFFKAGAARNTAESELAVLFERALAENPRLAFQTLLWIRDIRGGAGERSTFRNLLEYISHSPSKSPYVRMIVEMLPEFGRFDDLLVLLDNPAFVNQVAERISNGLKNPKEAGLAAKWMPRQGKVAAKLRNELDMSPKQWRKTLVSLSSTVEQKMCAKDWENIDYNKVPSVASSRYRRAFGRHDPEGYTSWAEKLATGKDGAKINAEAIFPHDVIKPAIRDRGLYGAVEDIKNPEVIRAQWEALPNFLGEKTILPMIDVSGSMYNPAGGSTLAIDVAIGLGLYLATKQEGPFKNMFLTFSGNPEIITLISDDIISHVMQVSHANWAMNTDIYKAFAQVLSIGLTQGVAQEDMPDQILILSDMEFDSCGRNTNYEAIKRLYAEAGYTAPEIVFWNLRGRNTRNSPVTINDSGTALVSGFSPSLLKAIAGGEIDPWRVFLRTVDIPRYREVFENIA